MSPPNRLSAPDFWTNVIRTYELLRQSDPACDIETGQEILRQLDKPLQLLATHCQWDDWAKKQSTEELVAEFLQSRTATRLDSLLGTVKATTELLHKQPSELQSAFEAGMDPVSYVGILRRVFRAVRQHCIGAELQRRMTQKENRAGELVRDFLVQRRDAIGGEQIEPFNRLNRMVLWNTKRHPDDLKDKEKHSIATESIFDELRAFYSLNPTALDPKGLEALIEGKFNQTPWKIRDSVRTHLRKAIGLAERQEQVGKGEDPDDVLNAAQPRDPDMGPTEARWDLEKVAEYLTPRQREFLVIRLQVDTDKDAAQKMGITPAAVSQLRSQITETARNRFLG